MKVILINITLFLVLFGLGESITRLINPKLKFQFISPNSYREEKILASRKSDQIPFSQLKPGVHKLFDTTPFTIDSLKRRLVPTIENLNPKKEFLFFGCSYTFGFNNKDDETMPYFFQDLSHFKVFNYGVMGGSPVQSYQIITKKKEAFSDVNTDNPTAVYVFFSDQIHRANNSPSYLFWAPLSSPYYRLENGKISGGDFLLKENPLLFWSYFTLRSSKFLQFIVSLSSSPKKNIVTSEELSLPIKLISESRRLFLKKYPKGKFLVYLFNGEKSIIKALEKEKIPILTKESFTQKYSQSSSFFQADRHLTPAGNKEMALEIFRALKL